MKAVQVSRRDFLKVSGMAGAGLALASCTAVVPETGTEAAPQEVTVFFWDGPPLIGIREEALAPFDEAYPGCELNFTSVPGGGMPATVKSSMPDWPPMTRRISSSFASPTCRNSSARTCCWT